MTQRRTGDRAGPLRRAVYVAAALLVGCGPRPSPEALPARWTAPVTGMQFVLVPAGEFTMGLLEPPVDSRPAPAHRVTLTRPFYLGAFEVTQGQWSEVMGTQPSRYGVCPDCPVESVSWHDARAFAKRLTALNPGEAFRLPTEAEWEYACRAGGSGRYGGDVDTLLATLANFDARIPFEGRSGEAFPGHPTPVGSYPPNAWGLSDMVGNVWEWTADEYCPYAGAARDPWGGCGTDTIPIRGGSWYFSAGAARCGRRYTHAREDSGFSLGLRVLREVPGRAYRTPGARPRG